ncbi:MAG: DJ-1 family glyoxalase III [Thermodesulfobacteriota bacterium]|nr:DJ-1 family glyoxalase III [Thermodesulfobacteriota bacterium]
MKKALVPIADGTEELEAITLVDVLRRAGADLTIASVKKGLSVRAAHDTMITADKSIRECRQTYDLIVLPGGMPGAENLRDDPDLTKMLKEQATSGRYYAAICASPAIVLGHHGLLQNKKATAYPGFMESPATGRVVKDENCITSQGPATAFEFALRLTEILFGSPMAQQVAKEMLYPV